MNEKLEMRFKGFSDSWKTYKLGDVISEFYNGQTPYRGTSEFWAGDINWLSSGDLNRGIVTSTTEKITEQGRKTTNLRIVPEGTVVIAIMGLEASGVRGNCGILGIDTTINQACMALFPDEDQLTPEFLMQWYQFVGNTYGQIYTQGTKQQNYNAAILSDLAITLPSVPEQEQIGSFFSAFDNDILLQQQKYEKLLLLKKAMLKKMFPFNGSTIPEVRFKGFTGEWKQCKLGELFAKNDAKNDDLIGTDRTISVSSMTWNPSGNGAAEESLPAYKVLRYGDLAFEGNRTKGHPYGKLVINDIGTGIMSSRFRTLKPKVSICVPFWKHYLTNKSVFTKVFLNSTKRGTLMNELVPEDLFEQSVAIPYEELEQERIGAYFNSLDKLINYQHLKTEQLKRIKHSLVSRMFL